MSTQKQGGNFLLGRYLPALSDATPAARELGKESSWEMKQALDGVLAE